MLQNFLLTEVNHFVWGTLSIVQHTKAGLVMTFMPKTVWIFPHGFQDINILIDQMGLSAPATYVLYNIKGRERHVHL